LSDSNLQQWGNISDDLSDSLLIPRAEFLEKHALDPRKCVKSRRFHVVEEVALAQPIGHVKIPTILEGVEKLAIVKAFVSEYSSLKGARERDVFAA